MTITELETQLDQLAVDKAKMELWFELAKARTRFYKLDRVGKSGAEHETARALWKESLADEGAINAKLNSIHINMTGTKIQLVNLYRADSATESDVLTLMRSTVL